MKNMISKIRKSCKAIAKQLSEQNSLVFRPIYRIASIEKDSHGDYEIIIQVIGKAATFRMKPEKILADDHMTDQFSPRDVRTLTYLGYLDINSPKYRILAQRLSEHDNRIIFALHKKGDKKPQIKTASEISKNKEILNSIDQHDAHMIGYTAASEGMLEEKLEKEKLLGNKSEQTRHLSKQIITENIEI